MKTLAGPLALLLSLNFCSIAQDLSARAWQLESKGDAAGARDLLERSARGGSFDALNAYAQFLDRHHDPETRAVYKKLIETSNGLERSRVARRLVELDLIAGLRDDAARDLELYHGAGGTGYTLAAQSSAAPKKTIILIPGPLPSFSRMAALSPDLQPPDVLAALARNIITNGYQAASGNEALEQTEYLKLVVRYLSQARELAKLAPAPDHAIKIESCDSSQTAELLRVLGYRMRGGCGSEVVLETVNATRAFLTIDSGFPLAELEQSLRTNRPFVYDYKPTEVPILYTPDYWLSAKERQTGEFIDLFLGDPSLCRLYLALSKLDPSVAEELRKNTTVQKIRAYAHVLDFYGGMIMIRNGRVLVPGGARSEKAWADLAGAGPDRPEAFIERLVAKDDGWLASFFDALSRIDSPASLPVQNYLTEPERMKRFYAAIRGKVTSPGPARPVFRSNTDMLLLTTRLKMDPDGRPHIPGGLEVWRSVFVDHPAGGGKYDAKLSKAAASWKDPDDVLEALFALCRKSVENEPLKIFMALTDMDRRRKTPLDAKTAERLAREYRTFGPQYPILSEVPEVTSATINQFLDTAAAVNQVHDLSIRADDAGTLQALVGLWQIFYRQGSILGAEADRALSAVLTPFSKAKTERDVFDGGREGVKVLLAATKTPSNISAQDRMIDLLAGTSENDNSDAHTQLVEDMIRIFEAQRLISLSTIFELADQLEGLSKGEKANMALVNKTAARISEIQLPRTSLSTLERNALSFGYWSEKHIETQRKLNLRALIDRGASDPKKLEDVRGLMAPFLRDTLVGLNYVHYAPPGAQVLYTNPLFVRSHDFIGLQGSNQTWRTTEVLGSGWPSSAGGKLVGSLVALPYALAEGEQNFLIPSREQALIWGDLVPQIMLSATVQRWWNVTPGQIHWVALHMDFAETQLADAALNTERRQTVLNALAHYAMPARVSVVRQLLEEGQVKQALDQVVPSEQFAIARELLAQDATADSPIAAEIRRMAGEAPQQLNYEVISHTFGTPKPMLANSYSPELLNLRTFPTLMGYSSRILAESWESNLLYYAALADQLYLQPAQLNVLVPEWTRSTVERIFATHLEDWPALLRSLRLVGDDAREKTRKQAIAAGAGGI